MILLFRRQLKPEVQRVVAPYLRSNYELLGKGPMRAARGTVFGRGPGPVVYREWLSHWLRQLLQHHARGELTRQHAAAVKLVRACAR